jgi:hypothetical protein
VSAHPVVLAVVLIDLLAFVCWLVAVVGAIPVAAGWNAGAATREQLLLERRVEEVSSLARLGFGLYGAATFSLLIAINHVLPSIVPGAMCGVGVLQAMPGGWLALAVRLLAFLLLWGWAVLDALDRRAPLAPLATASARALLVAVPVAWVAAWQTGEALLYVDVQHPVSCCAVVYDLAREGTAESAMAVAGDGHTVAVALAGLTLLACALLLRRHAARALPAGWVATVFALGALGWAGLAAWVLVDVAAPYLYGVLGHRCPLCFFLPHHQGIGYPLFGSLLTVIAGAVTLAVASNAAVRSPSVVPFACAFVRWATAAVVVGVALFAALAAGPALVWRLRFGVWIGG